MASETILTRLSEFSAEDKTPRLVSTIFGVIPGAPALPHYGGLAQVVAALGGQGQDVAAATAQLGHEDIEDVLWMSGLIDSGDRGYAVVTGISSAMKLFFGGKGSEALETDTQQRNDAVLKGLALAYLAWKSSNGSVVERAKAFTQMPAGQALLTYYAAVEIALPFADNALIGGANGFSTLMDKYGNEQMGKFTAMLGSKSGDGVAGALSAITGPIESALANVKPHVSKIASSASAMLPGAMNTADKAAGVLANVADVMPVYRYLGGRLAAESAVLRSRA